MNISRFRKKLLRLFRLSVRRREETPLEEEQIDGSHGHAAVREIEHRVEKSERSASYERNPGGPYGIYDREIEHIHDLAEHKRGVVPDDSVEETVDDVSEGSGGDEGQPDEHPGRDAGLPRSPGSDSGVASAQRGNPPHQRPAEDNPECGEQEFAHRTPELHPEGHPLVFDEEYLKPVAED